MYLSEKVQMQVLPQDGACVSAFSFCKPLDGSALEAVSDSQNPLTPGYKNSLNLFTK